MPELWAGIYLKGISL